MEELPSAIERRVLVVAPTRRDGEVTCELLNTAGVECILCNDLLDLARKVRGGAGSIVLTDASLHDPSMADLLDALSQQPAWSDIPTVLLTREKGRTPAAAEALDSLTNVTLLDRPSSTRSMVSAVESALRSRRKQFQIRDQLIRQRADETALRDADTRKDEFLATLAHELRNPLAAIFTAVQILARKPDQARVTRTVAMMDRQTRLLVKLIDDLMDVSRIATGKVLLQSTRLDMRSVVEAALETSQTVLAGGRHDTQVNLPDEPVWVVGDSGRLVQVIGNLLNNAAKYTPEGGHISITLIEEQGQAVVRVADDGAGIPADMLPLVFDMFTQVNRTLDRAQGGLGIGLSLVSQLIKLHGGDVQVESQGVDRGSVFTIQLPVIEPMREESRQGTDRTVESESSAQLRILVIDDNSDVAEALGAFLGDGGHDVRVELGGLAGLAAADAFQPQIVFCDIGMPGVDGHEVARRLRGDIRFEPTVLVALTGWGTEEHKERTRAAGFNLHLTKPVDLEEVEKILASL